MRETANYIQNIYAILFLLSYIASFLTSIFIIKTFFTNRQHAYEITGIQIFVTATSLEAYS
jgi:hypothetical protein